MGKPPRAVFIIYPPNRKKLPDAVEQQFLFLWLERKITAHFLRERLFLIVFRKNFLEAQLRWKVPKNRPFGAAHENIQQRRNSPWLPRTKTTQRRIRDEPNLLPIATVLRSGNSFLLIRDNKRALVGFVVQCAASQSNFTARADGFYLCISRDCFQPLFPSYEIASVERELAGCNVCCWHCGATSIFSHGLIDLLFAP